MSKNNIRYAHNTTSNHLNSSPILIVNQIQNHKTSHKGALIIILISTVYLGCHTAGGLSYLRDVEVQGKALSFSFYLPHTQRAGEITGAQALSLQCEGAVQGPLRAAPDVIERDLLKDQRHVTLNSYCP